MSNVFSISTPRSAMRLNRARMAIAIGTGTMSGQLLSLRSEINELSLCRLSRAV